MNAPTTRLAKLPLLLEPEQAEQLDALSKLLRIPKQVLLREAVSEMLAMKGYGYSDTVHFVREALRDALALVEKAASLTADQPIWQHKAMVANHAVRVALDMFPDGAKPSMIAITKGIFFPRDGVRVIRSVGVDFPAVVDGKRRNCRVTFEALRDHFGVESAHEKDLSNGFSENRTNLQEIAAQLLPEADGDLVIGTDDIE